MLHISSTARAVRHATVVFVVTVAMSLGLTVIGAASATAATQDRSLVGKSSVGKIYSTVVGSTSDGGTVTGSFTPIRFVERDGHVWAKGFLEGVITDASGKKTMFSGIEKMRVKKVNGTALGGTRAIERRATCDVLKLVLAPLDLDLLGLQVHLDRVVLEIVAVSGPGNLLGNLLCAVTGLLDGGLAGLLDQLRTLLNQILGALNLGV